MPQESVGPHSMINSGTIGIHADLNTLPLSPTSPTESSGMGTSSVESPRASLECSELFLEGVRNKGMNYDGSSF